VEAIIDEHGRVQLLEAVKLPETRRAPAIILEGSPRDAISETALLSQHWQRIGSG
jgi:hypothetical protein